MTVEELIEALQDFRKDATVYVFDGFSGESLPLRCVNRYGKGAAGPKDRANHKPLLVPEEPEEG